MNDRFEMMKFFDGARMAYDDCAELAEHLAKHSSGFRAAVLAGESGAILQPHLVAAVEIASKAILETFAETIRAKRAAMDRQISLALKAKPQTSRVQ